MQYIDSENEGFFSQKQTNETENFPLFLTFRYYNHLQAIFLDFSEETKSDTEHSVSSALCICYDRSAYQTAQYWLEIAEILEYSFQILENWPA